MLILTSRHDHVVPSVSGDVLAAAVSGAGRAGVAGEQPHVATLDLDREELERRVVEFASELGGAPDGEEQAAGDDARRGEDRQPAGH